MAEGAVDWATEELFDEVVSLDLLGLGLAEVDGTTPSPQGSGILGQRGKLLRSPIG